MRAGEETRRLAFGWETTGKGMPGCFQALGLDLAFLSVCHLFVTQAESVPSR